MRRKKNEVEENLRKEYSLAAEVLERVRKGQEKVYSAASVRNDLGLND